MASKGVKEKTMKRADYVREFATMHLRAADEALVKFIERLAEDAAYAFEWGDSAVEAAARQKVSRRLSAAAREHTFEGLLSAVQTEVQTRAATRSVSGSACGALLARAELVAWAEALKFLLSIQGVES